MPTFITYLMTIYICSYLLGLVAQKLVIKYKLDRHYLLSEFFRFDTPWFYLFKGFNEEGDEADFVKLAVTVQQVDATFLYYGIIEDFFLTDSGNLDRIVLSSVVRRKLTADDAILIEENQNPTTETTRFYEISGDRIVLKMQRYYQPEYRLLKIVPVVNPVINTIALVVDLHLIRSKVVYRSFALLHTML
ncbi:MAG: hypothetical protein ABW170_18600 [Candidatus Thiodiazotropha sp. L084R]